MCFPEHAIILFANMRNIYIFIISISFSAHVFGQSMGNDLKLIEHNDFPLIVNDNNYRSDNTVNNTKPILLKHKSFFNKINPFSLAAISAMLLYQNVVSPEIFSHCLYYCSCSNFSKKAIQEFGLFKGVFMSADRLLRCNVIAINDFPPEVFNKDELVIDEPQDYHFKSGKYGYEK